MALNLSLWTLKGALKNNVTSNNWISYFLNFPYCNFKNLSKAAAILGGQRRIFFTQFISL